MICLFCGHLQCYSATINFGLAALNRLSQSLPLSFSSSSHFLSFSKPKFRVGDPQSPFSISSSFILFFVSLPFFLKTKIPGWRPSIAILYLFLFHSLLRLTSFLSQNRNSGLATLNRLSLSLPLSFSSSPHFLSFSKPTQFQTCNTISNTCWPSSLGYFGEGAKSRKSEGEFSVLLYFILSKTQ